MSESCRWIHGEHQKGAEPRYCKGPKRDGSDFCHVHHMRVFKHARKVSERSIDYIITRDRGGQVAQPRLGPRALAELGVRNYVRYGTARDLAPGE